MGPVVERGTQDKRRVSGELIVAQEDPSADAKTTRKKEKKFPKWNMEMQTVTRPLSHGHKTLYSVITIVIHVRYTSVEAVALRARSKVSFEPGPARLGTSEKRESFFVGCERATTDCRAGTCRPSFVFSDRTPPFSSSQTK